MHTLFKCRLFRKSTAAFVVLVSSVIATLPIRICDLGNPHFLFTLHCIASLPIPPRLLSSYLSSIMLRNATQMSIMIMKPMHICFVFGSELQCIVLSWVRLIDSMNFS